MCEYKDLSEILDNKTKHFKIELDGNQFEWLVDFLDVGIGFGQQESIFGTDETDTMERLNKKLKEMIYD